MSIRTDKTRRRLLRRAALAAGGLIAAPGWLPPALGAPRSGDRPELPRPWPSYGYDLPPDGGNLIGGSYHVTTSAEDTLLDIARRTDMGYWDIVLANPGVDPWLPGEGRRVMVPARFILPDIPREGIVVNIPEMRLYYFPPESDGGIRQVVTHPVGIGRQDWTTPLGRTEVVEKIPEPTWYPPASVREEYAARGEPLSSVVPPGPDNPLGSRAIILDIDGYLLHGTNQPYGVGMQVSHGCVRLYPEDIEALFDRVPRGTPVQLVDQPIKLAWSAERLYAEVHALPGEEEQHALDPANHRELLSRLEERLVQEADSTGRRLHRSALEDPGTLLSGVPRPIPTTTPWLRTAQD